MLFKLLQRNCGPFSPAQAFAAALGADANCIASMNTIHPTILFSVMVFIISYLILFSLYLTSTADPGTSLLGHFCFDVVLWK